MRELKLHDSARSEWVFAQPTALPGPFEHFDAYWRAALEAAEISDFHFHDVDHKAKVIEKRVAATGR